MYRVDSSAAEGEAPLGGHGRAGSAPGRATNGAAVRQALGYTTVAAPGEGERERLHEEAKLIQAACREHGLALGKLVRDVESHSGSDLGRPGLSYVLERLAAKEYGCLVVARLDRLTRSPADLAALVRMLSEHDARLVVVDIGLDTATADGRVAAKTLVTVGELDETVTGEGRGRGSPGRPAVAGRPELKRRIADMRASGMTLQAIADTLNAEGVPTVRGGAQWRPSSVQAAAGYKRPSRGRGRSE